MMLAANIAKAAGAVAVDVQVVVAAQLISFAWVSLLK